MSFIYPAFLWALAALSIPVIIHLFSFRRAKRVLFTNVRFLQDIKQTTQSNLRLRHLLILLARLLFLAFLIMAFARPVGRQADQDKNVVAGKQHVAVYVDNSFSMQQRAQDAAGTSLDEAAQLAQELAKAYPTGTAFGFTTNTFAPSAEYFFSKDKLEEKIAEMSYANNYRRPGAILLRQQRDFEAAQARNPQIFWFSDFQKSTWKELEELATDTTVPPLQLVKIPAIPSANLYIDSVWLQTPYVRKGENNTLQVRVRNAGEQQADNVPVRFLIGEVQAGTATASVAAGSFKDLSMSFSINQDEAQKCKLVLQDLPVTFDNEYYFILQTAPPIKVMLISGVSSPFLKTLYSDKQLFDLQSYEAANIDYKQIDNSDLIVLEGIASPDASLSQALVKAVKQGKSVAYFPSEKPDIAAVQSFVQTVAGVSITENKADTSLPVQAPNASQPFFKEVFERIPQNVELPYARPVLSWQAGRILLRYKQGSPFLSSFRNGSGTFYLFAAPLSDKTSNFGRHSFFVVTGYRMAIESFKRTAPLAYSFQSDNITINLAEVSETETPFVLKNNETELIPNQRKINGNWFFEWPEADELKAGYYQLLKDNKPVRSLAFNYGRLESQPASYSLEELQNMLSANKNIEVTEAASREPLLLLRYNLRPPTSGGLGFWQ